MAKVSVDGELLDIKEAYQVAVGWYGQGAVENSKHLLLRITTADPGHSKAYNALGVIALDEGDLSTARAHVQRALVLDPQSCKAQNTMGNILLNQGDVTGAIEMFRSALAINQSSSELHANLGRALFQNGSPEEAVQALEKAIDIRNDFWPYHYQLGLALRAVQRLKEAENSFREVLKRNPKSYQASSELGYCLAKMGQLPEAEKWCRYALQLSPGYYFALNNLGLIFLEQRKLELALETFREAVASEPAFDAARTNIGLALTLLGRPFEALNVLEQITSVDKDSVTALGNIGRCLVACGKVDEALQVVRKAVAMDPGNEALHSGLLLMMNYSSKISADDIFRESQRWDSSFGKECQRLPLLTPARVVNREREKRLRIAYVSPDFRNHVVSYFFTPLLRGHDRSRFDIICYSNLSHPDEVTERIKNLADNWRDVYGMSDTELAELIRKDGIDILVDLAGHTAGNRLKMFAMKSSPIQVTWLGYPGTTGLAAIDYRLTDAVADPEGEADAVNVEKLVRLPHGFLCYSPHEGAPDVSRSPCDTNGFVTFGSFNRLEKISPETASAWGEILRRVPRSRLMIKQKSFQEDASREMFLSFLQNAGLNPERVLAVPYMKSLTDHLGLYGSVDISLDTYPYNGTTTTCESLWMGVPVVTLLGNRHASRVGASILSRIGMTDLIAESEAAYVESAVMLANDREIMKHLRSTLRSRMAQSPLTDSTRFSRQVEDAYLRMWQAWLSRNTSVGSCGFVQSAP